MQDVGIWSIIPPIVAILLAIITKEVIFSLICGILSGTVIYVLCHQLNFIECFSTAVDIMIAKLGENAAMILFLALLGGLVAVITKAGGSNAYASWARSHFKSRRTALTATAAFSACLFLDDYFNCITSGTVMRPVTDRFPDFPGKALLYRGHDGRRHGDFGAYFFLGRLSHVLYSR